MNKQLLYCKVVYYLANSVLNMNNTHFNYSLCIRNILDNIEDELNVLYTGKTFTKNNIRHKCNGIVITYGRIFALYGIRYTCYFHRAKFK